MKKIKKVGLTEFRRNLRKYIELLVSGCYVTLIDKRKGKEVATLQAA